MIHFEPRRLVALHSIGESIEQVMTTIKANSLVETIFPFFCFFATRNSKSHLGRESGESFS